MNQLAPLLPLFGLAALVVTSIRRRREKKERLGQSRPAAKKGQEV